MLTVADLCHCDANIRADNAAIEVQVTHDLVDLIRLGGWVNMEQYECKADQTHTLRHPPTNTSAPVFTVCTHVNTHPIRT